MHGHGEMLTQGISSGSAPLLQQYTDTKLTTHIAWVKHVYICIYIYMCVCVCVYVWSKRVITDKGKDNHLIVWINFEAYWAYEILNTCLTQCKRCMVLVYWHWRHASLASIHNRHSRLSKTCLMVMQRMHANNAYALEICLPCINPPSQADNKLINTCLMPMLERHGTSAQPPEAWLPCITPSRGWLAIECMS